jgi:hypothetical protein
MSTNRRKYREIEKNEFETFLDEVCYAAEYDEDSYSFDFIEDDKGGWRRVEGDILEHCYFVALDPSLKSCLKLYSGIDRRDAISRGVGEDAIRVVVANANTAEPIRPAFPKVKRISTWRKNLSRRMAQALVSIGIDITCPICKKRSLVLRKNRRDQRVFLGCSSYPGCTGNKNLWTVPLGA